MLVQYCTSNIELNALTIRTTVLSYLIWWLALTVSSARCWSSTARTRCITRRLPVRIGWLRALTQQITTRTGSLIIHIWQRDNAKLTMETGSAATLLTSQSVKYEATHRGRQVCRWPCAVMTTPGRAGTLATCSNKLTGTDLWTCHLSGA